MYSLAKHLRNASLSCRFDCSFCYAGPAGDSFTVQNLRAGVLSDSGVEQNQEHLMFTVWRYSLHRCFTRMENSYVIKRAFRASGEAGSRSLKSLGLILAQPPGNVIVKPAGRELRVCQRPCRRCWRRSNGSARGRSASQS
jgi:hypothetical protein